MADVEKKKYNFVIVNGFYDRYTDRCYESGMVVPFTAGRAKEIIAREPVIGYKLIVEQGKDTGALDVSKMPEKVEEVTSADEESAAENEE